jgi:tetratricopeptide (TPR) repeat protein
MRTPDEQPKKSFHMKVADFYAGQRKDRAAWKNISDIQANIEEIRHRIAAEEFLSSAKLLSEISFDHLVRWGESLVTIELSEAIWPNVPDTDELFPGMQMNLALAYRAKGDLGNSVNAFERGIKSASLQKKKGTLGSLLGNLGCTYLEQGRFEKAKNCHEKALAISRELQQRRLEGDDLGNLGNAYLAEKKYAEAIKYQTEALAVAREVKNRIGEGNCLANLGYATFCNGKKSKGRKLMEEGLDVLEAEHADAEKAGCLFNLGLCSAEQGDQDNATEYNATEYYERACKAFEISGHTERAAILHGELGLRCLAKEENHKAAEHLRSALEMFKDSGDLPREAMTRMYLGLTYFNLERYRDTVNESLTAAEDFRKLGDEEGRGKSLGTAGSGYIRLGDERNAYRRWKEAVEVLSTAGSSDAATFQKNLDLNFREDA